MANPVTHALVAAFYEAYASHDTARLAAFLHDDVQWQITGPVDVLPFCGLRRGKAAVIDLADRVVPSVYRVVSFQQDSVLVDGDRVATLNRMSGRRCADGRSISYRLAHFIRFSDGKVIENISLLDSFDAAEQMLGHPLEVDNAAPADLPELSDAGSIVAV